MHTDPSRERTSESWKSLASVLLIWSMASLGTASTASADAPTTIDDRGDVATWSQADLDERPLDLDPAHVAWELEALSMAREQISIGGITALQWISATAIIAGAVTFALLGLFAGIASAAGNTNDATTLLTLGASIGPPLAGLGILGLCLAELDGGLHHRRAIDGRIRRLRRATRPPRER